MSSPIAVVWTTLADAGQAHELSSRLVEEGLVACAQVDATPVRSIYRWEGRVENAEEYRLMLKLPAGKIERLQERLRALHPYDVPEFVVQDATASDDYARWVDESCP